VLQVLQAGYVLEDRVLRPAMVVTAKGGPKPNKAADEPGAAANDDRPLAAAPDGASESSEQQEQG
jgi:molecular chaperone GrpE